MGRRRGASRFQQVRQRLEAFDPGTGWRLWVYEFLLFGFKQGWACLFGGLLLALLLATHFLYPADAPLARYDFLTLAALAIQLGMLAFRLETWDEAKVILIFHVVGTVMEVFKTYAGSWVYPEPSLLRIAGVPLFSGFMYAAVGSYIARVWRIFDFRFAHYPPRWATWLLAVGVYANFFLHHYWLDLRWLLFGATALISSAPWRKACVASAPSNGGWWTRSCRARNGRMRSPPAPPRWPRHRTVRRTPKASGFQRLRGPSKASVSNTLTSLVRSTAI